MKTHTLLSAPASRLTLLTTATIFAMLCGTVWLHAQPTITLTQLLAQGFTNGPALGYSLRVTGIRNVSSAVFSDIRPEPTAGNEVQAHGGNLQIYGLNYAVFSASVDGSLYFSGSISLPPPLNQYMSSVADAQGMVVDSSGNIGFDSPGGTFTIPHTFEIGALTIDSVTLTINPAQQTYGGSALIGIGKGPTGSYCPSFTPGPRLFGAGVLVVGGALDQLTLQGSNLRLPLGTTGAFLDALGGTAGNLSANGGRNWYVQANATIDAGCQVGGIYPVAIDAQAIVNSAGYVDVSGAATVFGIPVGSAYLRYNPPYTIAAGASVVYQQIFFADCGFQVTTGPQFSGFGRGKLQIPSYVPVVGGWTVAQAGATFNNSGFRGSVTINITPEIPSVCTPKVCAPGFCIHWWSPSWSHPSRTCRKCWDGPCIPSICTPRIPAVSATVGFKYESGSFVFNPAVAADPMVEPWEKSFQEPVIDPQTGSTFRFMDNWKRLDKYTTGTHGRRIGGLASTAQPLQPADTLEQAGTPPPPPPPPPLVFYVPPGKPAIMFRLTWENSSNRLAFIHVNFSDYPAIGISYDDVRTNTHILSALDNGTPWTAGSYLILDGARREAIVGVAKPSSGNYFVQIDYTNDLGNYAVELLAENPPPSVQVNNVTNTATPGVYLVNYTTHLEDTNPATRFILCQATSDPTTRFGPGHLIKGGGIYAVDSVASADGTNSHLLDTRSLSVPDGDYNVVVNIDDPASLEAEDFSAQKITVHNASAPLPVPSFATRGDNGGMTVSWQASPSSNILGYIVAYTASSVADQYEFHQSVDGSTLTASVANLTNGQPYLVTVFAMGTNGLQSCPAETQRVIPTAGYGLNPPIISSSPNTGAMADQDYVYFPQVFDADDVLQPTVPMPDGEDAGTNSVPQDGQGRQWTLVTAPSGMTIDPTGVIMWTPSGSQVGDHQVTVRVTDLSSLPPLQDAGKLISPRYGEQTYTLTVVPANNPPIFGRNHYRFLTPPLATANAGQLYRYVPAVLFPTNSFTLTMVDGPPGLSVVQEGSAPNITNVVVWNVPTNALGHRVVLRALPNLGADTTADDAVLQEFFLSVAAPAKQLPAPTVITRVVRLPEGLGVSWVGDATAFQVQRATNSLAPVSNVWQNITASQPAQAVNFSVDTNLPPDKSFYRILAVP
jgi:hypothetical protein